MTAIAEARGRAPLGDRAAVVLGYPARYFAVARRPLVRSHRRGVRAARRPPLPTKSRRKEQDR